MTVVDHIVDQTPRAKERAAMFREMAERLDRNADAPFGGCFVIVPPGLTEAPVSVLILDSKEDAATFWATLKTKCDIALAEMQEAEKKTGWMRPR